MAGASVRSLRPHRPNRKGAGQRMNRTLSDDSEPEFPEPPHPADDHSSAPQPVIVCVGDVEREDVDWFWHARLAAGKVTLLIGDPGLGKSWITLYCAAQLS